MKRIAFAALTLFMISAATAAIPTPDFTWEQKEEIKNYTNSNLDKVPEPVLGTVNSEQVNVLVDGTEYGLKFEDGDLENIYNEGFSEPTVEITISEEAASQLLRSESPYKDGLDLLSSGEIVVDTSPGEKQSEDSKSSSDSSDSFSTLSGSESEESENSGNNGIVDSVAETVGGVASSVESTVTGFL